MAKAEQKEQKEQKEPKEVRKKARVTIPTGIVHIQATFNNTIVTFTDDQGNTVAWAMPPSWRRRPQRRKRWIMG